MLIGISGVASSGKDTAADFLVEDHGFTKVALADPLKHIAQYVYAFTDEQLWGPSGFRNAPDERYPRPCRRTGFDSGGASSAGVWSKPHDSCPDCHGTQITYLTPREVLQRLGTECGRECYPDTWIALCIRTATGLLANEEARYHQQRGPYRSSGDPVSTRNSRVRGVAVPDVRFLNEVKAIKQAGGKVIRISRPGAGLVGGYALHVSETEQAGLPDSMFDQVIQNTGTLEDLRIAVQAFLSA